MPEAPPLVAIIGAGPAGLKAAEVVAEAGLAVEVFEAMATPGRKFLMAGRGGLNLTHGEPFDLFLSRYGEQQAALTPLLQAHGPQDLRDWAAGLGVETFVGSSGRVFPVGFKAAPLLRAWLRRLGESGVILHPRHRWLGWAEDGETLRFETPGGPRTLRPAATLLALGGGSWAKLGSDGAWTPHLAARGVPLAPFRPANCGFEARWSETLRQRYAGHPLKPVVLSYGGRSQRGECVLTDYGIEGGVIYAFSAALRDGLESGTAERPILDLLPDRPLDSLRAALSRPRGSRSLSSHLKRQVGIEGAKAALLRECVPPADLTDPTRLAAWIKALPLPLRGPRPLDEAISTAGGVRFDGLTPDLMLRAIPGTFCAGEMLDWEAPTGGYLLTACFATGHAAGKGLVAWLRHS